MKNFRRAGMALVACLALAACGGNTDKSTEPPAPEASKAAEATESAAPVAESLGEISVFAAASLVDVLPEIQTELEAEYPGTTITYNFGGSSGLVDQLAGGASADLLLTANAKTMTSAEEKGLAEGSVSFTSNTLVLVVPAGNPGKVTGLEDASTDGRKLVVCAEEVPCGSATKQLEEVSGITLTPVSEEQAVTDVLGKVTSGEADAGLVYTTDAKGAGDKVEVIEVPNADDIINDYRAVVLKDAKNAEGAQKFLDLILSENGQKTLKDFGFGAPVVK
ncbi:MAG: molybdate ABC transporter substrate-binding protein [Ancrocorticia sp.]